jgi:hypothetical protein
MTRHKGALWLVDRAFIDAAFWDSRKKRLGVTLITRMKSSLCIDSTEPLPVADVPTNEGVLKDLRITLRSSRQNWRLITFRSRRGHLVEFLTNEFKLEPGVIAFLYSRRWEEEKCFGTWKNDFSLAKAWGASLAKAWGASLAKAWGASLAAIENQVRLAIVTSLLVALLLHRRMGQHGIADEKA